MIEKIKIKSYWVEANENEGNAPSRRIIHGKFIGLNEPQDLLKIGFKLAKGYFKCGSEQTIDWVEDAEIFTFSNNTWKKIHTIIGLEKPVDKSSHEWFEINEVQTEALFVSIRKSGVDDWWPCYNLAETAIAVEGIKNKGEVCQPVRKLHTVKGELDKAFLQKDNITFIKTSVGVKFESPYYSVGFKLKSVGLNFFGCDGEGYSKTYENLLDLASILYEGNYDYHTQGIVINSYIGKNDCGFMQYDVDGETTLSGNTIAYRINHKSTGQKITLKFTMLENKILMDIKRDVESDIELLDSSVFRISTSSRKSTLTALGSVLKEGETGRVSLPATLNFPGYSNIVVTSKNNVNLKFNSIRPLELNNLDFNMGEKPAQNGGYLLQKGSYTAAIELEFNFDNHIAFKKDTPEVVKRAANKYILSSLTYRADTATFANNGTSMGAPICLSNWAIVCEAMGNGPNGVNTFEFLRNTIEVHLWGAPAYATGTHQSGTHQLEDEYLMTGTAVVYGIAKYMACTKDKAWFERFKAPIYKKLMEMKKRDIDGDMLVESLIRKGVSGEHQWSTCWYDVISYGYKDAFSNVILYGALVIFADVFQDYGENEKALEMKTWAERLKASFVKCFMTQNGWFAGWQSIDGKNHDFAFLAVNGLAVKFKIVEGKIARILMQRLYDALIGNGYDSFDLGLPGNVFNIDKTDMAQVQSCLPFGCYQNAGITLSQSEAFISGLYTVGMTKEADMIVTEISKGLLYCNLISGSSSGVDWKAWDGTASGYEGILTDQFGVFAPILERFKK